MNTYLIAECGSCHDGRLHQALNLVEMAASAGASACKFQWTSNPMYMAIRRGKASEHGYTEHYRKYLAFPESWHGELARACAAMHLDYMCTVYLKADISKVAPYVAHFKVASFEAKDTKFLLAHEPHRNLQDVFVSTGMMDDAQVCKTVDLLWPFNHGPDGRYRLLHCTSKYPANLEDLNLSVLRDRLHCGLSDHSPPTYIESGALAVACGAQVIEAHVRLTDTDKANPDYEHAMSPNVFRLYIEAIRQAEIALGDGMKRVMPGELTEYEVTV
jgi:sialic acid synthase SpsE